MSKTTIKQKISKFIFNTFGERFNDRISNLKLLITNPQGREHYKYFGTRNPDKTIYLIRKNTNAGEGLLSIFTYVMGRIDYADRNGMLPFVDIDSPDTYSMFDKYFVLKTELSKEDVYHSKRVLLSGYGYKSVYPGWCNWINTEFNQQKRELFDKYIDFSGDVKRMVESALKDVNPKECLGLYLRGTDYLALKPASHPIQPTIDEVVPHINQIMKEEGLNRIFLVTEDKTIVEKIKKIYTNQVLVLKNDQYVANYQGGEYVLNTISKNGNIEYNNSLYLTKIILLSMCHSFVGGRTNGSSVANALNGGKYKRRFVYDVGYYQ